MGYLVTATLWATLRHQLNWPDSESDQEVMETDSTEDLDWPTEDEGKVSDHDKDFVAANQDLMLSEEQSYW